MTRIRTHKHMNTGITKGDDGMFVCVIDRTVDTKRGWFNTTTTRGKGI